jgi:hypothetical protein
VNFSGFDELFSHVQPYMPAAPYLVLEANMRQAAIEFCRRTRCWRWTETVPLAGSDVIISSFVDNAQIYQVEEAYFEGEKLESIAFKDVPLEIRDAEPSSGVAPMYLTQSTPGALTVLPPGTGDLRLSIFLEPMPTARAFPTELCDKFGADIANGAAWRTLLIPEQPYTNPQLAAFFKQRFDEACDNASSFNMRGQQRARVRTKPSWV